MSATQPRTSTDPTRRLTQLVLVALVLIGVAVLARRFWPAQPRTQMPGGLKQLAGLVWLREARAELQEALDARERRHAEQLRQLRAMTPEERERILSSTHIAHPAARQTLPLEALEANLGHPDLGQLIQQEDVLQAFGPGRGDRMPWQRRKELYNQFAELYRQFATLTGLQEPWSSGRGRGSGSRRR